MPLTQFHQTFVLFFFCFRVFFFSSVTIFETIMLCYVCRYITDTHTRSQKSRQNYFLYRWVLFKYSL